MSGPNDSGTGDTPTGDLKFPAYEAAPPSLISSRFRLSIDWRTPHLQWLPKLAGPVAPRLAPLWPELDDPAAAVQATVDYVSSGGMLFDLWRPNWLDLDRALLAAPTEPPRLLPTFDELRLLREDGFFRRLSAPPFIGPLQTPAPLLSPPLLAPPPQPPFFKLPDPPPPGAAVAAPRAGQVGDLLKALEGVRPVQELKNRAVDRARLLLPRLEREWNGMTPAEKIPAFTLSVTLAAGVAGAALYPAPTRHLLFQNLEGLKLPVPYVPGTKFSIDHLGKWDNFLVGAPSDPKKPAEVRFSVTVDLLEAVPAVARWFK